MEKEIGFSGLNLTPYSDMSPDGQLTFAHGLEMHNGSVRAAALAGIKAKAVLPDDSVETLNGYVLQGLHRTSSYSHLLFTNSSGSVAWGDENVLTDGVIPLTVIGSHGTIYKITSVGNTLVVLTDKGCAYYLWSENSYKYIGDKLPELAVQLALCSGYLRSSDADNEGEEDDAPVGENYLFNATISNNTSIGSSSYAQIFQNYFGDAGFSEFAWSRINKMNETIKNNNAFYAPFFIRAAYHLYDGTVTQFTHPVLLVPSTIPVYTAVVYKRNGSGEESLLRPGKKISDVENMFGDVTVGIKGDNEGYAICMKNLSIDRLSQWKDIVSSVDLYITPQVLPYKYESLITKLYYKESLTGWRSSAAVNYKTTDTRPFEFVKVENFEDNEFTKEDVETTGFDLRIPMKNEEDYKEELAAAAQFYKIKEISLDEIQNDYQKFKRISLTKDVVSNLVQQPTLDDSYDYHSHDTIIAQNAIVYNSRLNLFNVSRQLFQGFSFATMHQYFYNENKGSVHIYVYLHAEDGKDRIVESYYAGELIYSGLFFYYPDSRAYKIVFIYDEDYYELPLSVHPYLNGAYYLSWDKIGITPSTESETPSIVSDAIVEHNKIYCSDSGNPFVFPVAGIHTVGTGSILGISSVATPLSQGQFGQFPLLAFCSDGNYALSVDSEGAYTTISPIQRDQCTVPSSITQTDNEVIFITARGVMMTNGTTMASISDVLDGLADFMPTEIPRQFDIPAASLAQLINTSLVAYDYPNQRFIFFGKSHSYLYNLSDRTWTTANYGDVTQVLSLYPDCYLQFADEYLVKLRRVEDAGVSLIQPIITYDDIIDGKYAGTSSSSYTSAYEGGDADAEYDESKDSATDGGTAADVVETDTFDESDPIYDGVLFTRPVKLDSYRLKRIHQFALQGVFENKQRILLYASQDGRKWLYLGATTNPRARMVGKLFKYFRFAIITRLRPGENISGLRIDYELLSERRYRQ